MKKKELVELRGKDAVSLNKLKLGKKIALIKTETDLAIGREKNLKKAKNLRYDIAQIETLVREKEFETEVTKEISKKDK